MKTALVLLVLLAASLAVPMATAQTEQKVTLTITQPTTAIPYGGSIDVPVTVTVTCSAIVQNLDQAVGAPAATLTVHADEPPTWLTVKEATIKFPLSACAGGTSGTVTSGSGAHLNLTVDKSAPGVVTQNVTIAAHFAAETPSDEKKLEFTVAYHSDYSVLTDATFPIKVVNGVAYFNVTMIQNSNARSMIMIEDLKESTGKISGIGSIPYDPANAKTLKVPCSGAAPSEVTKAKVFCVKFQAPSTPWTNATVSFTTKGHYLLLDQRAGDLINPKPVVWTFTNGGGAGVAGTDTNKASPLPLPFLAIGLAAFAARRKTA